MTTRTEGQSKRSVEADCLRRDFERIGEIHEGVERFVDVHLAAIAFNPVTELNSTEAKGILELLRGGVSLPT